MKVIDTTTVEGRIRFFAKQRHGSIKHLALVADVDADQLGKYRDGRLPTGDVLARLIGAGLNAHWLLTGMGIMDADATGAHRPAPLSPEEEEEILLEESIANLSRLQELRRLRATATPAVAPAATGATTDANQSDTSQGQL